MIYRWILLYLVVLLLISPILLKAEIYSSDSFKVLDPVINVGGGFATSSSDSFRMFQVFGQFILGTSTSGIFNLQSGFLAFPVATSPVLSATAGDAKVDLSWTASEAFVGWTVTSYDVGTASVSGGPYTFENAGIFPRSFSKTGLTNATTYYFRVRTKDALGYVIATSTEAWATPVAAPAPPVTPPGGGGGVYNLYSRAIINGFAYPQAPVILLKDGQIAAVILAEKSGNFKIDVTGLSPGNYNFSVYAKDNNGLKSNIVSFPAAVEPNKVFEISGIFIPPTLSADKVEVKKGETLEFYGQSAPGAEIFLQISPVGLLIKTRSDNNGNYLFRLDTSSFDYGFYSAKTRTFRGSLTSGFSYLFDFRIGTEDIFKKPPVCPEHGDFNGDCRVNIVDFSILIYWFFKGNPPAKVDMNADGKVDLFDFSIMAYYWTG